MLRRILQLAFLLLLSVAGAKAQDLTAPVCGLTNDSTNHVPTGTITTVNGGTSYSWHDFVANVPAIGGTWVDNTYGCTSMVLTNVVSLGTGQVHNYAISPAMDRGDCYILALDANAGLSSQYIIAAPTSKCSGGFGAGAQTVISSAQMPARTSHNEFVWDYFTQGKFWFANGNLIRSCTITGIGTTSCSTAHTFSEYAGSGCNFMDYAAMNSNGFIDAVCQNTAGGQMDVFSYDTVHDAKGPVYTTTCTGTPVGSNQPGCIHKMAGPTKDNGILIQFVGNACGTESGNHLWAPPFTLPTPQIECLTDHVDVMGDLSGNSVALYEDYQDNSNYCLGFGPGFSPALTFLPLSGNPVGQICVIKEFGWDISTRDYPIRPWGLYSVQGSQGNIGASENCNNNTGGYADPSSSNWNVFSNELILTRVDAANNFTKIWRLGLTHERGKCGGNTFYSDPRAAISIDGNYVVYDTNARCGTGTCTAAVLTDIVLMGGGVSGGLVQPLFPNSAPPLGISGAGSISGTGVIKNP